MEELLDARVCGSVHIAIVARHMHNPVDFPTAEKNVGGSISTVHVVSEESRQ
jgi:hypothetical protein